MSYHFTLIDKAEGVSEKLNVLVNPFDNGSLEVVIEGYGDNTSNPGYGVPIYVELNNGVVTLYVWSDIDSEEPTHVIPLDGAKESRRTIS